jgi:type IV pilus assembly protein PilV
MSVTNDGLLISIKPRRQILGFTLLEVLVAVVVMSIGLLGLAGLQAVGLRQNHSANLRSQASVLANDIVDRMRANRRFALEGAYDVDLSTPTCEADPPLSGAVATRDLTLWKNSLACSLPSGDGSIVRGAGNLFTISIQWDDSRGHQTAPQEFELEIQL